MRKPDLHSEGRLDQLRRDATGFDGAGAAARGRGEPSGPLRGYAGRPILKPPVWTWEVPLYFFIGGAGGAATVIALAALLSDPFSSLTRAALALAAICGAISPMLLISDLGRPRRALNMFRVFKRQSPMSVGSWALFVYGTASAAALFGHELAVWGVGGTGFRVLILLAAAASALGGLVVATYTGVLLGVTAIPVWNERHRILPVQSGATGLGTAAAILSLLVPNAAAPWRLLLIASVAELAIMGLLELDRRPSGRPLHTGPSGQKLRLGGLLTGPVTLLAGIWGALSADPTFPGSTGFAPRVSACVAFLAGALLLRIGWIQAGSASAADPAVTLDRRDRA